MAWTTPSTAVAGSTALTAAFWNEQVRDNMLMGNPVFTDEAARDAAIPSPVEGQRCYLTAPTIPAATGDTTAVPSGMQTIYNGSVWVCVTPVAAFTSAIGTTTSTSYSPSLSGTPGTNPSVTLVTGTTARVSLSAVQTMDANNRVGFVAVSVSGATTMAASDDTGLADGQNTVNVRMQGSIDFVLTGLTAGTNTFTLEYKINTAAGATLTVVRRHLIVSGIA